MPTAAHANTGARAHETAPPRHSPSLPWPALLGPVPLVDAQALDALALQRDLRDVREGHAVFVRGDAARALMILVDGQAVVGHAGAGRTLKAERVVHAPGWLDLAAAWGQACFDTDARAQTAATVAELPVAPLRALLAQRPALALRFVDLLAGEVVRLGGQTHELMHKDAPARLAAWLQRQLDGHTHPELRLCERKRDIASQLGMTPETLSRMMRSLSDQGLIRVAGYTVQVLDPKGLARLAGL